MSDLDTINVGGVDYSIKDATARTNNDANYLNILDLRSSKAPISHSSSDTRYGIGNDDNFGHVKLSDTVDTLVGYAGNGIGASQSALHNVYLSFTQEGYLEYNPNKNATYVGDFRSLKIFKRGSVATLEMGFDIITAAPNGTRLFTFNSGSLNYILKFPLSATTIAAGNNAVGSVQLAPLDTNNNYEVVSRGTIPVGSWYFFQIPNIPIRI